MMTELNIIQALQELRYNFKRKDSIKARLVLHYFDKFDMRDQQHILSEIEACSDSFAIPLLVFLANRDTTPAAQFSSLSETILSKALQSPDVIIQQLRQQSPEKLYYVKLAGDILLQKAVPVLIETLMQDSDTQVLRATMEALGAIGDPESINAITEMLYLDKAEIRGCAVQALGHIATPTAMLRLAERLGTDDETDMRIIDVFGKVQDAVSMRKLNESLQSLSSRLRNYCKDTLVAIGPKAVLMLTENLSSKDTDLLIHSLNILQEIGDESALQPVRKLISSRPANANVRFAAYETLANLPPMKGDYILANGLLDPVDNVRLAAARAVDHFFDEFLRAGIANMIGMKNAEAVRIIKAVIDAQAKNIFLHLLEDDFFQSIAFGYLAQKVHQEIRDFFIEQLRLNNHEELAHDILSKAAKTADRQQQAKICAVDDSRMVLSVYRSILTELNYEPVLFHKPADAIAWLNNEKPVALCTDLNMPDITGVELIKKIRAQYSKEELPIIMVTTQNDIHDNRAAYEAGADDILHKPFDAHQLNEVLGKLLDKGQ